TRYLHCNAGIMVTASHNPAKYNGYKAYGADGCQMTSEAADTVYAEMLKTDVFEDVKLIAFEDGVANGSIKFIEQDVIEALYENIKAQSVRKGSGNVPVRRILADIGITDITVVPEQEHPDGNFPTCPYPNPEIRETLSLGLALAEKLNADLMLATDPDADRVGIAVRNEKGGYELLSGNEVGVLLLDYICAARIENGTMPKNPIMVKSLVSTCLADMVAKNYGVEPINVLTGFKYIGEQIHLLEEKGEAERFVFGFEESYGYLSGTYVRDKDAVVASMLICEMAAYYKSIGKSVLIALQEIYTKYGRWLHKVDSLEFAGLSGMDKMKDIMSALRSAPPKELAELKIVRSADYLTHVMLDNITGKEEQINLPAANVLIWWLENGASVIVRPSGTEPKIKVYYSTGAGSSAASKIMRIKIILFIKT
ncbi:MAG: phospho-sugar mutase, partial [Oscillospiraceae bacterium]